MIVLKESDLHKKVAQLLVVRASGYVLDSQRQFPQWELKNSELKQLLEEGIGGVILFGGTTFELQNRTKTIRSWAHQPIFLCADVEEGLGQRFEGGTWLVPPLAVGQIYRNDPKKATAIAENYGACIGVQARECGLNWVLAPVCDINNNSNNPVINLRAWGEDPLTVADLVSAFHKGLSNQGVLTCAKHFPGHGDTSVDSHLALPIIEHDLNRLKELELVPFEAVIASGVETLMTAHILFPNIDSKAPATLSAQILTKLLREEIGFDGLLVTDALVMDAIRTSYGDEEAVVMAFEAGADLLMMPVNPKKAIHAICNALLSGRIPMTRLEESLHRRQNALDKLTTFDSTVCGRAHKFDCQLIERKEDKDFAEDLLLRSIKIRSKVINGNIERDINLVRIDGLFPCQFLTNHSPAFLLAEEAGYKTTLCHQMGVSPWQDDAENPLALDRFGDGSFLLQLFIRGNPFRGSLFKKEPWLATIRQLQRLNRLSGVILYGSPFFWNDINQVLEKSIPCAYSPGQMNDAQKHVLLSLLQTQQGKQTTTFQFQEFTD